MEIFGKLLSENRIPLERFVRYKINNTEDANDLIQEISIQTFKSFSTLKNVDSFKP